MSAPKLRVLESAIAIRRWRKPDKPDAIYAFVNIEVVGRGIATGRGCLPLSDDMLPELACQCGEAYTSFRFVDTAYGIHTERSQSFDGRHTSRTAARSACYLFDAAILDALLGSFGHSFFRGMTINIAGIDGRAKGIPDSEAISRRLAERRTRGAISLSAMLDGSSTPASAFCSEMFPARTRGEIDFATSILPVQRKRAQRTFALYETILAHAVDEEMPPIGADLAVASGEPLFVCQSRALTAFLQRHDEPRHEQQSRIPVSWAALIRPGFASYGLRTPSDLDWL